MKRFTLSVNKVHQSTVKDFEEIEIFHQECNNYRVAKEKLNPAVWSLRCKRCKREIIEKDNAFGNLPIMQTAVDGKTREYNHELAKEKVILRTPD